MMNIICEFACHHILLTIQWLRPLPLWFRNKKRSKHNYSNWIGIFRKTRWKKNGNLFLAKSRAIVALSTHFGCFWRRRPILCYSITLRLRFAVTNAHHLSAISVKRQHITAIMLRTQNSIEGNAHRIKKPNHFVVLFATKRKRRR